MYYSPQHFTRQHRSTRNSLRNYVYNEASICNWLAAVFYPTACFKGLNNLMAYQARHVTGNLLINDNRWLG